VVDAALERVEQVRVPPGEEAEGGEEQVLGDDLAPAVLDPRLGSGLGIGHVRATLGRACGSP